MTSFQKDIMYNMIWSAEKPTSPLGNDKNDSNLMNSTIEVRETSTGRGLFAIENISKGSIITDSPVFTFQEVGYFYENYFAKYP